MKAGPTSPVPVLFVSHGSPMFALQPGRAGPALAEWSRTHAPAQHLKGLVVMSPHWMTSGIAVTASPHPAPWHDFGGFPPALYRLQYPASGAPALAAQLLDLLRAANLPANPDPERPLDHGCWVPLMHLYPQANVPVVQVSLPADAGPAQVYALGQALAPLREQGILLIGSGSMTHNLYELRREDGPTEAYVTAFCDWVHDTLMAGDLEAMLDCRGQAPHAVRAHPSDEHFLTVYFALGAAGWGHNPQCRPQYITREVQMRSLSMDAFSLA
ncbi:MAG: DODA-type extradiol aromatic ring-opening family dioxygenase [Limnohabitans sp.]